jgi:hypothetical protein
LDCHCDINGATSVLPAPVRLLEVEALELPLPDEELEPHAASPSDAAMAKSTVLVRMSFFFIELILVWPPRSGVSEP